jgi:hypothetical protein
MVDYKAKGGFCGSQICSAHWRPEGIVFNGWDIIK